MKLIDRFVSRELLVNVLFAILVLSLVLVVGNIFRKLLPLLVSHDVPMEYLLTFIAYVLPFSLIFTIGDTLRGNPKVHPELLVWFPNVLFLVLGAFLFRRLSKQ